MENPTITMFESFYIAAQDMDTEDRVKFYEAIMVYGFYGEESELSGTVKTVFTAIKPVIERSRQMRESGRKGGRPRKTEETVKTPFLTPLLTERKGKDMEKDMEMEKDMDKERKRGTRFAPPTVDDVRAYCTERGNGVDPQRFVDFYQSKGWKVGNNTMRDWKAAVRTWEQRDAAPKKAEDDTEIRQYYQAAKNTYPNNTKKDEGWERFRKLTKGNPGTARRLSAALEELVERYYSGEYGLISFEKDLEVAYEYIRH